MTIEQVMVLQLDREEVMMIETVLISKTVGGQDAMYQAIKYKRQPARMIPIMLLVNTLAKVDEDSVANTFFGGSKELVKMVVERNCF